MCHRSVSRIPPARTAPLHRRPVCGTALDLREDLDGLGESVGWRCAMLGGRSRAMALMEAKRRRWVTGALRASSWAARAAGSARRRILADIFSRWVSLVAATVAWMMRASSGDMVVTFRKWIGQPWSGVCACIRRGLREKVTGARLPVTRADNPTAGPYAFVSSP
jgi:hypothetical protein